jgi:branched-chain amino acid aminotransferase
MDIEVVPLTAAERKPVPTENLGFGTVFSDHIFQQSYTPESGWHGATIGPPEPICLSPAASIFHYAQEIFEGTKAYRRADGHINLFRPWENMRRFNNSARRMAMPEVDEEDHLQAIVQLIELDHRWVPAAPGSLYIRPTMIATDVALGVHASLCYLHYVLVGPVGSYFKEGFNPIPVYISDRYRRAVVGGTGDVKTGGNYAASLLGAEEARRKGYSQVLWLDAVTGRNVEEVGAMNICFVYGDRHIVTPALSGSILPGITRKSVIQLGRDLGYEVSEETIDVREMLADVRSGRISEVFGCGTAAVIAPVGKFGYLDEEYVVNGNQVGPVSRRLYDELTGIQFGRRPDPYGWIYTIEVDQPVAAAGSN